MQTLASFVLMEIQVLLLALAFVVGRIDLSKLLSEPDGYASLSRFQFLIFTFVIAMSLCLIIVSNQPLKFPDVPGGILALLGISGGSYVVAKGNSDKPRSWNHGCGVWQRHGRWQIFCYGRGGSCGISAAGPTKA